MYQRGLGIGICWTLDRREDVPFEQDSHAATDERIAKAAQHHDFLRWSWEPKELINTATLVPKWAALDYLRWKTARINSFGLGVMADPYHLPTLDDTELSAVTSKSLDLMSALATAVQTTLSGLDYRIELKNEPGIKVVPAAASPQQRFYTRVTQIIAASPDPSKIVIPCYQAGEDSIGMTTFQTGKTYAFHLNRGTIARWESAKAQLAGKSVICTEVSGDAEVLRWVRKNYPASLHHAAWGMENADPNFTPTFEKQIAIGK